MFGNLGPKLQGGWNTLIAQVSSGVLTIKAVFGLGVTVSGGDGGGAVSVQAGKGATSGNGGAVTITAGAGGTSGGTGGAISITAGAGTQSNANGGSLTLAGGAGVASIGAGGAVTINGGNPGGGVTINGSTGADGAGPVLIKGGPTQAGTGGTLTLSGGVTTSSGTGGAVTVNGGDGVAGGGATLRGGDAVGNGNSGGGVTIRGGISIRSTISGSPAPGAISIIGGNATGGTNQAAGGAVSITGGQGGASSGVGGAVTISGGAPQADNGGSVTISGAAGVGTNKNGGNVTLTPGAATGTGTPGNVILNGSGAALSTSATGGFTCFPTCVGTPTGTPGSIPAGTVPMVFDTSSKAIFAYTGGSWNSTGGGATYTVFGGSGASHSAGLVPDPGATAGTTKYLREDGTWTVPPSGVTYGGAEAALSVSAVSTFTQTNFGTTGTSTVAEDFTAADGTAGIRLRERGDGGNNNHLRSLLKTAPGGSTWTMLARLRINTLITQWQGLGITLYDSASGKYIFYGWAYDNGPVSYITWSAANTYGTPTNVVDPKGGLPLDCWFGFYYDGTNLNFLFSRDGNFFVTLKKTALTAYLPVTPTAGGIGINPNCFGLSTQETVLECLSFYYASGAPPVPYSV